MDKEEVEDSLWEYMDTLQNLKNVFLKGAGDVEKLEKRIMEDIEKFKNKEPNPDNSLIHIRKNLPKTDLLDLYFKNKIKIKPNSLIKSADLCTRINNFFKPLNQKISREEISQYLNSHGIKEEKIGQSKHFSGIELIEEDVTKYMKNN